ncbi:MAG: tRNA (guanosine(46)-N7)-methyltransferase TrmB [Proteobacteria bacterium]|nr:tRNA (guanosine(46)-N7)-methyltransferase TrmB [Pseudomonadota bacterium]
MTSHNNPYIAELENHTDIIKRVGKGAFFNVDTFCHPDRRLILDLGCGAGNFLRDYAEAFPQYNFIGFELRYKRLVKGAIKFKKGDLSNIRLVKGRAEEIPSLFQSNSIDEININFPDPWANKKRQLKHRLITSNYLEKIYPLLKNGGNFVLKTDHQEYFNWVLNILGKQKRYKLIEFTEDLHKSEFNESNIPTEFELLFRGKNFPVYYLKTKTC